MTELLSLPRTDLLNSSPLSEAVSVMFNDLKIDMITDLTDDEIKLITKIYMVADLKNVNVWSKGVKYYLRLLLSRKRKSRAELLQAIEGSQKRQNFLEKLLNVNNRGDQNKY